MPIRRLWPLSLAALALAAVPFAARAAGHEHHAPAAAPAPAGWSELVENLRTLPARMLAKLPEAQRNDPQIQQEVARLALETLASTTLETIGGDGDAPQFLPSIGQVLNIGQPNADTIYRTTTLTPGASYRIRGVRGSLNQFVLAQVLPQGVPNARAHLHLDELKVDAAGRYDVLVSPVKPEGYSGDWWELNPGATRLMLRMVSADWAGEKSPTIAIERVDRPASRPRPPAARLEQRLRALPQQIDFLALMFVDRFEQLRAEGFVNKVKAFTAPYGPLAGQFYYEGTYDLADDEALIVESPLPAHCPYRSLILTNEIYETIDWINNHSSLNLAQAAPDSDGKLRIVISAHDPGVKNWMDTAGHPRGIIQGRWTNCDSQPIPEVRKVKLSGLAGALPADVARVTPAEREAILRERRRAYLERPFW